MRYSRTRVMASASIAGLDVHAEYLFSLPLGRGRHGAIDGVVHKVC